MSRSTTPWAPAPAGPAPHTRGHTPVAPVVSLALGLLLAWTGCARQGEEPVSEGAGARVHPDSIVLTPATAGEILTEVRNSGGRAVVVHVWATWCIPCREEFPDLMRLYRDLEDEGLDLILISADFPRQLDEARGFLADHGVDFPSFLMTGNDMEFINGLDSRWTGALPATWIYDGQARMQQFWENRVAPETLRARVLELLSVHDSTTAPSERKPKDV